MFGKKNNNIDYDSLNEVIRLSKRILRVFFTILILSIILIAIILFDKLKVFKIISNVLKVIAPFFIGLAIAWLLDPLVTFLQKKKIKRGLGTIIVVLVFGALIFLLFRTLIPLLFKQLYEFIDNVPELMSSISKFMNDLFNKFSKSGFDFSSVEANLYKMFDNITVDLTSTLPKNIISVSASIISSIATFGLGVMVGIYLLIDFDRVKKVFHHGPFKNRTNILDLISKLNTVFRDFVQGTLFIALIVSLISTIGYTLVGLPSPLLFGVICGLTNMIPYIGPWIGGALCVIVGFTISPLVGILSLVVAVLVQQIDGMVLQPLVMGKTMKLHPVVIMLGLLVFGYFFGILGMILATPVIGALKIIIIYLNDKYKFMDILKNRDLKKSEVKNESGNSN